MMLINHFSILFVLKFITALFSLIRLSSQCRVLSEIAKFPNGPTHVLLPFLCAVLPYSPRYVSNVARHLFGNTYPELVNKNPTGSTACWQSSRVLFVCLYAVVPLHERCAPAVCRSSSSNSRWTRTDLQLNLRHHNINGLNLWGKNY